MRLICMRHGQTPWNLEHRIQGHTDIPLNERGHAQAQALAERLSALPLAAVYASPLQRAYDTGAECCIIEDAQQVWLVCSDEVLIAQYLPHFDQGKACFESADIVAIAAQYISRTALSPTTPLTP